ncbi:hypothetical protein DNTS_022011 [Danionella cerebrum]|uniref:Zona pellucida sperm-binding protein 3 n=1 Tax=Danionella cerebrum TaxID=2873325 RepID=A0A553QQM6_9TELE|nr:hypothetical protein DNTS_022011 [Danionella translucida]
MIGPDSRQYKTLSLPDEDPTVASTDIVSSRVEPVQVFCTETSMIVLVSADLLSNGRQVSAEELSLGWPPGSCGASLYSDTEYVIKSDLHQCGSTFSVDEDRLVYSNFLIYTPKRNSLGIARTTSAYVPVECHYKRSHFVSSVNVKPSWDSPTNLRSAMELIRFSFHLMNDDWSTRRSSNIYQLGEVMNIQASFMMAKHAPFRLVMDRCVVSLEPNAASMPRYTFVKNHGCLIDSKVPESSARFLERKQNHVLQMQMDAFRFREDQRNSIYIICQLKVADLEANTMDKACTYFGNRWFSVDGKDDVCDCCESTCDVSLQKKTSKWSDDAKSRVDGESNTLMLGPITVLG